MIKLKLPKDYYWKTFKLCENSVAAATATAAAIAVQQFQQQSSNAAAVAGAVVAAAVMAAAVVAAAVAAAVKDQRVQTAEVTDPIWITTDGNRDGFLKTFNYSSRWQ